MNDQVYHNNVIYIKQYGLYNNILYSRLISNDTYSINYCWVRGTKPFFKGLVTDIDIKEQSNINMNTKMLDKTTLLELFPEEFL